MDAAAEEDGEADELPVAPLLAADQPDRSSDDAECRQERERDIRVVGRQLERKLRRRERRQQGKPDHERMRDATEQDPDAGHGRCNEQCELDVEQRPVEGTDCSHRRCFEGGQTQRIGGGAVEAALEDGGAVVRVRVEDARFRRPQHPTVPFGERLGRHCSRGDQQRPADDHGRHCTQEEPGPRRAGSLQGGLHRAPTQSDCRNRDRDDRKQRECGGADRDPDEGAVCGEKHHDAHPERDAEQCVDERGPPPVEDADCRGEAHSDQRVGER